MISLKDWFLEGETKYLYYGEIEKIKEEIYKEYIQELKDGIGEYPSDDEDK